VVRADLPSFCFSQTSANRIVIFDQHFNPTVTVQAIHRLFRFGQTKPVFCYNLLTQGTTEEKIYGRCVNKTGVSLQVVDKLSIARCFTAQELEDLLDNLIWVQCEKCEKWRVLVNAVSDENIPESWDCSMNTTDPCNNKCEASEKSQAWYEQKYYTVDPGNDDGAIASPKKLSQSSKESHDNPMCSSKGKRKLNDVGDELVANDEILVHLLDVTEDGKKKLVANDEILVHLLDVTEDGKKKKLICEHYFHESLMETTQVQELLNRKND
jgi:CW-type Zinc Finger